MTIQEIEQLYGRSPQANAFLSLLKGKSVRSVSLQGLLCSSVPMFFAPLQEKIGRTVLFVLNDADEAGYFYHDLTQMMGQENTFFFPSSYRRAIKYGQRDAASEILRTEVLAIGIIFCFWRYLYCFLSCSTCRNGDWQATA